MTHNPDKCPDLSGLDICHIHPLLGITDLDRISPQQYARQPLLRFSTDRCMDRDDGIRRSATTARDLNHCHASWPALSPAPTLARQSSTRRPDSVSCGATTGVKPSRRLCEDSAGSQMWAPETATHIACPHLTSCKYTSISSRNFDKNLARSSEPPAPWMTGYCPKDANTSTTLPCEILRT